MKRFQLRQWILPIISCAILVSCSSDKNVPETPKSGTQPPKPASEDVVTSTYTVVRALPHDTAAFTQGLELYDGVLLESTGQFGSSSIRRLNLQTGKVLGKEKLEGQYFGEGITVLGKRGYMLTWLNQRGFVFDPITLKRTEQFAYSGEGWGITNNGTELIMSNGTNVLTFLDPNGYRVIKSVPVLLNGSPLPNLNELEWVDGQIWANVWQTDKVVRIDPNSGRVVGVIDFTGILADTERAPTTDVFNGIAYDSKTKQVYVTGKNWPKIFVVTVK